MEHNFLFTYLLFMPTFLGTLPGHVTRAWCIFLCQLLVMSFHLMRFDVVTWIKVQMHVFVASPWIQSVTMQTVF
jgi:hypothetical protein